MVRLGDRKSAYTARRGETFQVDQQGEAVKLIDRIMNETARNLRWAYYMLILAVVLQIINLLLIIGVIPKIH